MKLSPEQIARLEAFLTDYDEGVTAAGLMIQYGLRDLNAVSGSISVLRSLGIVGKPIMRSKLSARDRHEFVSWLREKRAREDKERGLQ